MTVTKTIKSVWNVNSRILAFASVLFLLCFPLEFIDGIINLTIIVATNLFNFLFSALVGIINFLLSGLIGAIEGLFNAIASGINSLFPEDWGEPFPSTDLSYTSYEYVNIEITEVNFFDGGTLLGFLLSQFGIKTPFN